MNDLTLRALNNFGNSWPSSFSEAQSGICSRGSGGRKPCSEEMSRSENEGRRKVDLIRGSGQEYFDTRPTLTHFMTGHVARQAIGNWGRAVAKDLLEIAPLFVFRRRKKSSSDAPRYASPGRTGLAAATRMISSIVNPSVVERDGTTVPWDCSSGLLIRKATNTNQPMVRTTRKRALPLNMRSYAAAACSSGNVSTMGLTPVIAQKCKVSSESRPVPEGQP